MPRVEAILTGLVAKALKGDVRATETVLRLLQQHFPGGEEDESKLNRKLQRVVVEFVDPQGRTKVAKNGGSGSRRVPGSSPRSRGLGGRP